MSQRLLIPRSQLSLATHVAGDERREERGRGDGDRAGARRNLADLVELAPRLSIGAGDLEHHSAAAFGDAEAAALLTVSKGDFPREHDQVAVAQYSAA